MDIILAYKSRLRNIFYGIVTFYHLCCRLHSCLHLYWQRHRIQKGHECGPESVETTHGHFSMQLLYNVYIPMHTLLGYSPTHNILLQTGTRWPPPWYVTNRRASNSVAYKYTTNFGILLHYDDLAIG